MRGRRIHSPSNAQRLLYSFEARATAFESGLKMWDVCVHGTPVRACQRVNISRDIGSTVGKPCDQPASIVTLPTQTNAWTGAKVPARRSASPAVCSPFFPPLPSSSSPHRPRLTLPPLFCSLSFPLRSSPLPCPSVAPHPFLTSCLPPLRLRFSLHSVVQHVFPVSRALCLIFVFLKRFRGLTSFQVCFKKIKLYKSEA